MIQNLQKLDSKRQVPDHVVSKTSALGEILQKRYVTQFVIEMQQLTSPFSDD